MISYTCHKEQKETAMCSVYVKNTGIRSTVSKPISYITFYVYS